MPPVDPTTITTLAPLLPAVLTACGSAWVITRLNVRGLQRDTVQMLKLALDETRTEVADLRAQQQEARTALRATQEAFHQAQTALEDANARVRTRDLLIASLQQRVLHLEQDAGIAPTAVAPRDARTPQGAGGESS